VKEDYLMCWVYMEGNDYNRILELAVKCIHLYPAFQGDIEEVWQGDSNRK
jgi:hypothetical protein